MSICAGWRVWHETVCASQTSSIWSWPTSCALTDDSFAMLHVERVQTTETLRDLQHMSTRQFAAISS